MGRGRLLSVALVTGLIVFLPGPPEPEGKVNPERFRASIERLDSDVRDRMIGSSWRRGCPVPLRDLRLVRVTHWGFDGKPANGRLVIQDRYAKPITWVMQQLFEGGFRIRLMRLVDAYGASDRLSMRADNTSAFNCREIAGRPGVWSQHAFGAAIDINPVENPYVTGDYVSPPAGRPFADRTPRRRGMIAPDGAVVRAFARIGWGWGGDWSDPRDYQHFSATGG
ncbi:MAG: M15 family metallopeptidase [Solirubrobacterales bacterium]